MDIGSIISIIAGMMGGMAGGGSSSGSNGYNLQLQQQMGEMLNEQRMRMRLQNPLYEETQQLMRSLMPRGAKPTSYVLPSNIVQNPEPPPNLDPTPQDPNPQSSMPSNAMSQAVRMMASGISPIQQAKLFRR